MNTADLNMGFDQMQERIVKACQRAGRKPSDITVIGVTKSHPAEAVRESLRLGISNIGESYVQEAVKKIEDSRKLLSAEDFSRITWHFIGNLQTNKIKYLNGFFRFVHSIDNHRQLEEMNKRISEPLGIFFEINTGDENSKGGIKMEEIRYLIDVLMFTNEQRRSSGKGQIEPVGLMCIPPQHDNAQDSRPHFTLMRKGLEAINDEFDMKMNCLSMGMSHDFDVAIEEGATHIRVGTLLYGERDYA